jgi:hypothetical protein
MNPYAFWDKSHIISSTIHTYLLEICRTNFFWSDPGPGSGQEINSSEFVHLISEKSLNYSYRD